MTRYDERIESLQKMRLATIGEIDKHQEAIVRLSHEVSKLEGRIDELTYLNEHDAPVE